MPELIDPGRLYSFSEACRLIPSPQGGSLSVRTLWRWHAQGQFVAECRPRGGRRFWFVRGSEILKLTETEPCRAAAARAPRAHGRRPQAEHEQASRYLDRKMKELGV